MQDSIALRNFLSAMSRAEKTLAIDRIVAETYVSRSTVYNWMYGQCRIPTLHKYKIEEIFSAKIFTFVESL